MLRLNACRARLEPGDAIWATIVKLFAKLINLIAPVLVTHIDLLIIVVNLANVIGSIVLGRLK